MSGEVIATLIGALLTGGVGAKMIDSYIKRRETREDSRAAERAGVSVIEGGANKALLESLLNQMNMRIEGYETAIREMQTAHARDIAEVKSDNKQLERRVQDLTSTLRDWQLGNRVPRGQVLVPIREIRKVRERFPGLLDSSWYPGEDPGPDEQSIVARITPVEPPRGGP